MALRRTEFLMYHRGDWLMGCSSASLLFARAAPRAAVTVQRCHVPSVLVGSSSRRCWTTLCFHIQTWGTLDQGSWFWV